MCIHQSTVYQCHRLGREVQALDFHCGSTEKLLEEKTKQNQTKPSFFNREKSNCHVFKMLFSSKYLSYPIQETEI